MSDQSAPIPTPKSRIARALCALAALIVLAFTTSGAVAADPVADFYRGRTIQLVVGYGPGGGNDVYARLIGRHLGTHIPGKPSVVVQNMPGAGSLIAANWLANVAPRDGSVIGTFARNLPLTSVLGGQPNVRFDARKLTWLGSASSYVHDAYVLWVRPQVGAAGVEVLRQPGRKPLVLAGTADGDASYDVPRLLERALGLPVKLIGGYPDSNALYLAVEKGEVDGRVADLSSVTSSRPDWLSRMRPLLQLGRPTRHPRLAAVPLAIELAGDAASAKLIELAEVPFALSRPYAGPGGVPLERAAALRAAFMAAQRDPDYLTEAKRLELDVSPIDGDQVMALLDRIAAAPPETAARMRELVGAGKR